MQNEEYDCVPFLYSLLHIVKDRSNYHKQDKQVISVHRVHTGKIV